MEVEKIKSVISQALPTADEVDAMTITVNYKILVAAEILEYVDRIYDFLKNNNRLPGGNNCHVDKSIIRGLADLKCAIIIAFEEKTNTMVGLIVGFLVPTLIEGSKMNKPGIPSKLAFDGSDRSDDAKAIRNLLKNGKALPTSYTTFSCVHVRHRKHGLARDLVIKLKEVGEVLGIKHGYHIMPSTLYPSHIKVKQWMRPVDSTRARNLGFKIPDMTKVLSFSKATKTRDRSNRRGQLKMKACLSRANFQKIGDEDVNDSFEEYMAFSSSFKFRYAPSKKHWRRYVQHIPTYRILSGEEVVGIFSAMHMHMTLQVNGKIAKTMNIVMAVGDTKDIVTAGIKLCKATDALVLYMNEIGCLDGKTMDRMFCLETNHAYSLLNFNLPVECGLTDICLPLF